jgi:hypothetical protein
VYRKRNERGSRQHGETDNEREKSERAAVRVTKSGRGSESEEMSKREGWSGGRGRSVTGDHGHATRSDEWILPSHHSFRNLRL